ncbi:hypothetical protein B0H16DRAFT_1876804 [Mycena metata]|uniref:Uncharacterized protein n=1 Tax=Mycena metata TaxID=1033252 RepID=A0AAD7KGQ0_9AGAR|nr:hypothetical protein B0H16DRAFT_1876804 [Mycena metata]
MASLLRSAKPAHSWTGNELLAYNIATRTVAPQEFFINPNPSLEHLDPALLATPSNTFPSGVSEATAWYLKSLGLATRLGMLDDFARETLRLPGLDFYESNDFVACTRFTIPFQICGETVKASETAVCLLHHPSLILLIVARAQTGFDSTGDSGPHAQVIAMAVSAFQYNNQQRIETGLQPLESMVIPCIAMADTRPTFYLVPVTLALSTAVETGQYPPTETVVSVCFTDIQGASATVGMEDLEYRKLALERFLAFKNLARDHWKATLEGVCGCLE